MDSKTTNTPPAAELDDYIRFLVPSKLKKDLQFQALRDGEDMSEILRRLIQQYVDERRPL